MVDPAELDENLIAAVRGALDPGPVAPPPASVLALRLAVLERWGELEVATGPARARRWPRRGAVLTAVTTALTLGGGTVAFARPALPGPLRDVARLAGLPVSVEPAARVRIERAELERSLDAGNVARVQADLQDLNRAESKLPSAQQVGARAADEDLEQRARTVTGGPTSTDERGGASPGGAPATSEPRPTEAPPASPAPAGGDERSSTTTTPASTPPSSGGEPSGGAGSTSATPPPSGEETRATTTTTQPPSSSDSGHSMSTSSTGGELLQTPTVEH